MTTRRETLKQSAVLAGLLGATGLFPQYALAAFNKSAFEAKSLADAFKALGVSAPVESTSVTIQAPDIAENGAVVPIGAASTVSGVKQFLFLVEKNPTPLVAVFNLSDSVDIGRLPHLCTGQNGRVHAVAQIEHGDQRGWVLLDQK